MNNKHIEKDFDKKVMPNMRKGDNDNKIQTKLNIKFKRIWNRNSDKIEKKSNELLKTKFKPN
jgi:hypothetical protein